MFGLLNLNKPAGLTSRDAVNYVKRCLPRKTKLGHAGTLDPIASGVLLVCVGPATRLIPYIHQYSKCYRGTFQFGQYSETDDIEHEPTPVDLPSSVTEESIQEVLPEFIGKIDQVPPKFSAVRVNGERAYDVARRGEDFELAAKQIYIHSLQAEYQSPLLTLDVECGTGTYIRSLGRDIAQKVGTQCVMTDLVRTRIGPFKLQSALNIDELTTELIHAELHSPVGVLDQYPQLIADEQQINHLRHGRFIDLEADLLENITKDYPLVILNEQEQLVALGIPRNGQLAPSIVFPEKQ